MKKSMAMLLSAFLLIQIAMLPVSAAIPSDAKYTIVDTCYNPDSGRYVAVAKDLAHASTRAELLYSDDGETWKLGRAINGGLCQANPQNRQTVVWYKGKFITQMQANVLVSEDGIKWDIVADLGGKGNSMIETNGEQLIFNSSKTIRVYEDITQSPVLEKSYSTNPNVYGKAVSGTNAQPYKYLVMDRDTAYVMTPDGAGGANVNSVGIKATDRPKAFPIDIAYSASLKGWIVADGTTEGLLFFDENAEDITYLHTLSMADGSTIAPKINAVAVNDAMIIIGTSDGAMYVAANTPEALEAGSGSWSEVGTRGNTQKITEPIQSITAIDDHFFFGTKREFYEAREDSLGWGYHVTSDRNVIIEGAARIEIPETGEVSEDYAVQSLTWDNAPSEDGVESVSLVGDVPSGVTAETTGDGIRLTVGSETEGGHSLKVRAKLASGYVKDMDVTIVDEASVKLSGSAEMIVPVPGAPANRYEYTAEVIGTDGGRMETRAADITVEPAELPEGIELEKDGKDKATLVIASDAKSTTLLVKAAAKRKSAQMSVALSERRVDSIEITAGAAELVIPDGGALSEQYAAVVYDQAKGEMKSEEVRWSVAAKDIPTMDGISIDAETGKLSVEAEAYAGAITVRAASVSNDSVFQEQDVTLSFTDLRITQEDLKDINFDTSVPVENDLELKTKGEYGSKISWRSSDTKLLEDDGTVIRPSREDQKVKLICTAAYGTKASKKEFEFTIKKADNLCANGDFAEAVLDGWVKKSDDSSLEIKQDGGKNVLSISGEGAYHEFTFTNDSSYAFELTVKADAGKTVKLSSLAGGAIAEVKGSGAYQTVKATLDYRKQKDSFTDKIFLECDGMNVSEFKVYEITLELNAVSAAVNKAEYTKKAEDIAAAKKLVDSFYDLPVKKKFQERLDSIDTNADPEGNKRPQGGGGGGGGSFKPPAVAGGTQDSMVVLPEGGENNDADELDTYLLTFKDMKRHWAREDVEYMASLKIVNGTEEGTFSPDDTISRAEFAALAVRTMGFTETEYENSFFDVVKEDWYSGYAQTAKDKGFMMGYNGLFTPNAPITREEIAKVIVEAYHSKAGGSVEKGKALYFNDLEDISFWAYDYIAEAVDLGFMNGVSEETFSPKSNATRAQAAVLLRRVYDKLNAAQ